MISATLVYMIMVFIIICKSGDCRLSLINAMMARVYLPSNMFRKVKRTTNELLFITPLLYIVYDNDYH